MNDYYRNEIWNRVKGIGDLVLEEILVVGIEPVLFVCRNEDELERYLVMTYDSDECIFVISKIMPGDLVKMLKNEISMDETFRLADTILVTHIGENDVLETKVTKSNTFDANMLPDAGEFFDLKLDYIDRYISKLEKEPQIIFSYELNIEKKSVQIELDGYSCRMQDRDYSTCQKEQKEEVYLDKITNVLLNAA